MTAVQPEQTRESCPFVKFEDLMAPETGPGEHFALFDRKREEARLHFGDAAGHPFFMLTRMKDIRASFQDTSMFSNRSVTPYDPDPPYLWIPEMLDGKIHVKWRQLLGAFFSPGRTKAMEAHIRERFAEILDDVVDKGECDFVQDVALRFPNTIFMEMLGLPTSEAEQFQSWETRILHNTNDPTREDAQAAMMEVIGYFAQLTAERRQNPQDDMISTVITWQIDGEPVSDDDLMALLLLLFMAGLDTVAAQLSFSFLHLAENESDRRRIVEDPSLIPSAIEEFLRYYSFVTPGRKIIHDGEILGCPVKGGEMVYLPLVAANRDPDEFPDADQVLIDRSPNPHIAFGAGPHRCLGAHLARLELTVAIEMWHERIPDYRLNPDVPVTEHGGQIGLNNVPLVWDV